VTSPSFAGKNARRFRAPSVIPGFGLTFGYTLLYLGLIVLFPLAALIWRSSELGFSGLYDVAAEPRVAAALRTTFLISFAAAVVDLFFGLIVAWVLTRYDFLGRRLLDAFVDLPFALPTAVAGISLAALYSPNGWFGAPLADYDIKVAFTR
jgi:sulfate transport system permease protein